MLMRNHLADREFGFILSFQIVVVGSSSHVLELFSTVNWPFILRKICHVLYADCLSNIVCKDQCEDKLSTYI